MSDAKVRADNQKFIIGGFVADRQRAGLHPDWRQVVANFEADCWQNGYKVKFISGHRSKEHQNELHQAWYNNGKENGNGGIYAAPAGGSSHEVGLAFDMKPWNPDLGRYDKRAQSSRKILKEINQKFGAKYQLRWGGNFSQKNEEGHFDYGNLLSVNAMKAKAKAGDFIPGGETNKYIVIDPTVLKKANRTKQTWSTDVGGASNEFTEFEEEVAKRTPPPPITRVEERSAVGIWKIVKVIADRYSLGQTINDATISTDQGSLINFVKKVIQEPWLQFYGETFQDQFYFIARKEPFDLNGWNTINWNYTIQENQVISDDLNWYNGPIYSWYQIIPSGSFLGEQNQIFAHVTAVFFEEYAEVWGSKPLSVVNNYLNFVKNDDGPIMYEKAMEDLRYMVESNMYLPFTREGTITLRGRPDIKKCMRISYYPTREVFYVDAVSHRLVVTDTGTEYVTTLKVSRGMDYRHSLAPKSKWDNSYFNLVLFDDPPPLIKTKKVPVKGYWAKAYFDNDRSYLINLDETWPPSADTRDKKMERQIAADPNKRAELKGYNDESIRDAVTQIMENPECPEFFCKGTIDEDFGSNDSVLPIKRAKTLKQAILDEYAKRNPTDDISKIDAKITATALANSGADALFTKNSSVSRTSLNESQKKALADPTPDRLLEKALNRFAYFIMPDYEKNEEYEEEQKGINWKVNDKVFQWFLNRKQFNKCS
jgi:hypothetical protein